MSSHRQLHSPATSPEEPATPMVRRFHGLPVRWRFGILAAVFCALTMATPGLLAADTQVDYSVLALMCDPGRKCCFTPAC